MAVTTTWTVPTAAGMDIPNGQPWTETVIDNYASDLYRLGGTDGNTKTGELHVRESTVSHGVTTVLADDVFGALELVAAAGGLQVTGIREGGATGIALFAVADTEDTTHATTSRAIVEAEGRRANGTGTQAPAANANIFGVRSNGVTKFLVDQEGDLHVDGSTTLTAFDAYDDALLVRAASRELTPLGLIRDRYDEFVRYGRRDLEAAGLVHFNDGPGGDGRPYVNVTGFVRLHSGSIWQLAKRLMALEARLLPAGGTR